jgi:hypothetical protein
VPWPDDFTGFLRAMQILTLDLGSISGFFCTVQAFDFYDSLLAATLGTLAIVSCIGARVVLLTHRLARQTARSMKSDTSMVITHRPQSNRGGLSKMEPELSVRNIR